MIAEASALVTAAFARGPVGPFQVQAAIASLHAEASSTATTDWRQIVALYDVLVRLGDNPMAALSHAIAIAMVDGPRAGLAALDRLAGDPRLVDHHRLAAARAHLLERSGDRAAAILAFERAAGLTTNTAERDYLVLQTARLRHAD